MYNTKYTPMRQARHATTPSPTEEPHGSICARRLGICRNDTGTVHKVLYVCTVRVHTCVVQWVCTCYTKSIPMHNPEQRVWVVVYAIRYNAKLLLQPRSLPHASL